MAHSLRCRLKELWRRGMLKDGDLERIVIIPKDATDGDVIMAMFPNAKIKHGVYGINGTPLICLSMGTRYDVHEMSFVEDFWDAPYKGETHENKFPEGTRMGAGLRDSKAEKGDKKNDNPL